MYNINFDIHMAVYVFSVSIFEGYNVGNGKKFIDLGTVLNMVKWLVYSIRKKHSFFLTQGGVTNKQFQIRNI